MAASSVGVLFHRVFRFSLQKYYNPVFYDSRCGVFEPCARCSSSEPKEPPIPEWQRPKDESIERTKARLVYQSRKRGISENGLLLGNFADRFLDKFSEAQLAQYDTLINKPNNDWDIFNWATGNKPIPPEYDNEMMKLLKEFVSNPEMESRIRQPDLPEK